MRPSIIAALRAVSPVLNRTDNMIASFGYAVSRCIDLLFRPFGLNGPDTHPTTAGAFHGPPLIIIRQVLSAVPFGGSSYIP